MSFILDALKKSENDRQRQSGPALFEVRVPPPRAKFPVLAAAIVALLLVNLAVVAWLMTRKSSAEPGALAATEAASQTTPAGSQTQPGAPNALAQSSPAAPPANGAPAGALPQGAAPAGMPPGSYVPGQTGAAYGSVQPGGASAPPGSGAYGPPGTFPPPNAGYNRGGYPPPGYANQAGGYPAQGGAYPGGGAYPNGGNYPGGSYPNGNAYANNGAYPAPNGAYPAPNGGYTAGGAPAFAGTADRDPMLAEGGAQPPLNPDDYAPAREPTAPLTSSGHVVRGTESGLPTYDQVASRTTLPPLHLDMHSYAADPSKRFVLINMKRLYEGQSLPEGARVERITTDAAIVSYNGTQFVLQRD